ncbi:hypothetical protein B566_EDAN004360 [Ephemera danica]|nr:hypothetical protein B566_EDAN004360 [Ephemera danica]
MASSISCEYREVSPFGTSVEIVEIVSSRGDGSDEQHSVAPKDRFLHVLDELQKKVEVIRFNAQRVEDEKDSVMASLDALRTSKTLQNLDEGKFERVEKSEIENYIDMINNRCQTVQVKVNTQRNGHQEDSLHKVNTLIDSMVLSLRQDPRGTHGRCLSFMRACATQNEDEVLYAMVQGLQPLHADKGFEEALLGCTLDDQKLVKRRLGGLLDYILNF